MRFKGRTWNGGVELGACGLGGRRNLVFTGIKINLISTIVTYYIFII